MDIKFIQDNATLTVFLHGSLDTLSAPELERQLREKWEGISHLAFDFSNVDYVSSAGLRIILVANKHMKTCGTMTLCHVNEDIREVFEMTGFDTLLNFS